MQPDQLDAIWKQAVEDGDDMAIGLNERYQHAAEEFELALAELRDLARMKANE